MHKSGSSILIVEERAKVIFETEWRHDSCGTIGICLTNRNLRRNPQQIGLTREVGQQLPDLREHKQGASSYYRS